MHNIWHEEQTSLAASMKEKEKTWKHEFSGEKKETYHQFRGLAQQAKSKRGVAYRLVPHRRSGYAVLIPHPDSTTDSQLHRDEYNFSLGL